MLNTLINGINNIPGVNIPTLTAPQIPTVSIPLLAKGAVIEPNSPFLAVLGDQRRGKNIEAPLSTIEKAVSNVLNDGDGHMELGTATLQKLGNIFGSQLAEVVGSAMDSFSPGKELKIQINGQTLARALVGYLHEENVRMGVA